MSETRGLLWVGWVSGWAVSFAMLSLTGCGSDDSGGTSGECSTSQACVDKNGGEPSVCRASHCLQLTSEDCISVSGDYLAKDPILIGSLGPLKGDYASSGIPPKEGAELAVTELRVAKTKKGDRPLALVACHDDDDPERAAQHLIDVGTPAIVGAAFSGVTIKVAQKVTIPAGALLVTPSATSPAISDLADKGLVWRTVASDVLQGKLLTEMIPLFEQKVRTDQALAATEKVRVAAAVKSDAYGVGLADVILSTMTLNGAPVSGENAKNVLRIDFGNPDETPNIDYKPTVDQIIAFKPHIVLGLGTNEVVTDVLKGIEAAWPATTPRPLHLFADGGKIAEMLDVVGTNDELRKRVFGTFPERPNDLYADFVTRYQAKFEKAPDPYAENGYDAAYVIGYAAGAADGEITGESLAAGISKLVPPGSAVDVGPDGIAGAYATLKQGNSIDLRGIAGPLDYDLTTGDTAADVDLWCLGRDSAGKLQFASSGQYYDSAKATIQGTLSCP